MCGAAQNPGAVSGLMQSMERSRATRPTRGAYHANAHRHSHLKPDRLRTVCRPDGIGPGRQDYLCWVKQADLGNGVHEMVIHNRIENKQITMRLDTRIGPTQGVWMPTYIGPNNEKPLGNLRR